MRNCASAAWASPNIAEWVTEVHESSHYVGQPYGYDPMEDATSATLVRPPVFDDAELVAATGP
ncbi:hypothetical protein T265_13945, partial [Opisthorchis viverrini]